jgi:hypothetical protein
MYNLQRKDFKPFMHIDAQLPLEKNAFTQCAGGAVKPAASGSQYIR